MREGSPEYQDLQAKLHLLDGAPLSILAALFGLGRPAGVQEICRLTPYSSHTTAEKALAKLAGLGLVVRLAYRGGWQLTGLGRQLPFFGPEGELSTDLSTGHVDNLLPAPSEPADLPNNGKSLAILASGAGSGGGYTSSLDSIKTTTTPPLATNWQVALVQQLLALGGLSPARAERAVGQALERGELPAAISAKIAAAAAYIHSRAGRSLRFPGAWAAGFVERGFDPPAPPTHAADDTGLDRFDGYLAAQDAPPGAQQEEDT